MRSIGWLCGGAIGSAIVGGVGCFSPFHWPELKPQPDFALVASENSSFSQPDEEADSYADDALNRAADLLATGRELEAIPFLKQYLRAYPDAQQIRFQLAEVCFRCEQWPDAEQLYEELLALPRGHVAKSTERWVLQAHTRLMQLAALRQDEYGELIHRASGLLTLVKHWDATPGRRDPVVAEQTLAKALEAVNQADEIGPSTELAQQLRREILLLLDVPLGALSDSSAVDRMSLAK